MRNIRNYTDFHEITATVLVTMKAALDRLENRDKEYSEHNDSMDSLRRENDEDQAWARYSIKKDKHLSTEESETLMSLKEAYQVLHDLYQDLRDEHSLDDYSDIKSHSITQQVLACFKKAYGKSQRSLLLKGVISHTWETSTYKSEITKAIHKLEIHRGKYGKTSDALESAVNKLNAEGREIESTTKSISLDLSKTTG